jgi:hypothetical protein
MTKTAPNNRYRKPRRTLESNDVAFLMMRNGIIEKTRDKNMAVEYFITKSSEMDNFELTKTKTKTKKPIR